MNIKSIFCTLLSVLLLNNYAMAQDTSAYELQRNKINALLAERSGKFGQYEESLSARTGIFGLQTKRDIKNSNEILRQIALNDNAIFTELKVLLDYKDLQFQQVKTDGDNHQARIDNYKKTIRDLQVTNDELLTFNKKTEQKLDYLVLLSIFLSIALVILGYLLNKRHKELSATKPSEHIKVL